MSRDTNPSETANSRSTALEAELAALAERAPRLAALEVGERLAALDALGLALIEPESPARSLLAGGYAFAAGFLRRENIEKLLLRELKSLDVLDRFVPVDGRKRLRVLPRGTVCHWIAGNVPLLGLFSWALSAALGNANAIRLSTRQQDFVSPLLDVLSGVSEAGRVLSEATAVVAFDRDDRAAHEAMSRAADVRIAWGGQEAVESIQTLPRKWHCEDVAFGPRVSLAVVDPAELSDRMLERLAVDIAYFDQLACSSPQHVYVKVGRASPAVAEFRERFTEVFARQAAVHRRHPLDFAETYQIVLDRARLLVGGGELARDTQTQWSVATVDAARSELHGANRFVQLIPFDEFDAIYPRIPRNVQTVVTALGLADLDEFTREAATRGVCRFPRPGEGNHFESPWDGVPIVSRLTRWVVRTDPADA